RVRPWSGWRDLNSRHLAPKASALPGCATPRKRGAIIRSPQSCSKRKSWIFYTFAPAPRLLAALGLICYKASSIFLANRGNRVELTRKSLAPYAPKKGEEYMNARQRTHFRKILENVKAELSQEIDRTVHTMQDEATVFADPNDRASQESDMALELRNRDRERKLIKKIDETIARIDANEYGYCDSCGVEIGLKRLEARPTATLCIDCKTLDEMRERQVAK